MNHEVKTILKAVIAVNAILMIFSPLMVGPIIFNAAMPVWFQFGGVVVQAVGAVVLGVKLLKIAKEF